MRRSITKLLSSAISDLNHKSTTLGSFQYRQLFSAASTSSTHHIFSVSVLIYNAPTLSSINHSMSLTDKKPLLPSFRPPLCSSKPFPLYTIPTKYNMETFIPVLLLQPRSIHHSKFNTRYPAPKCKQLNNQLKSSSSSSTLFSFPG
jgi:hypothetical protein